MTDDPRILALARRARNGDREALRELAEQERMRLFALAYAELRRYEDAQDAVGAALVQVCLHVGKLRDPARAREWLNAVVRNEARRIRRRQSFPESLMEAQPAEPADPGVALRVDIDRALRSLPAELAHCITLFYLSGLSVAEVAGRIGRPEGTIKRWLHEGRHGLAREMEAYRPMESTGSELVALILGDPGEEVQGRVTRALLAAGFDRVIPMPDLPPIQVEAGGDQPSYHLPEQLRNVRLVVLDDGVAGGRWLEQTILLRATEEGRGVGLCQLLSRPPDAQVYKAWVAGCDFCFTKETLDEGEVCRLVALWLSQAPA